MMTKHPIQGYVKAEPLRPFCLHLASGRTFEIRHPELMKILRSTIRVFKTADDSQGLRDEWETVRLCCLNPFRTLKPRSAESPMTTQNVIVRQDVGLCSQEPLTRRFCR